MTAPISLETRLLTPPRMGNQARSAACLEASLAGMQWPERCSELREKLRAQEQKVGSVGKSLLLWVQLESDTFPHPGFLFLPVSQSSKALHTVYLFCNMQTPPSGCPLRRLGVCQAPPPLSSCSFTYLRLTPSWPHTFHLSAL